MLIAAKHPPGGRQAIGGVQTWSATVAAELYRLGHEVKFWGPEFPLPSARFDAGIFANLSWTQPAVGLCSRVLKVAHGIVPDEKGGPGFAATSEEVAKRWGCKGPVIRQPVDLAFWTPGDADRTLLTQHSYRGGLDCLPVIAEALGLRYRHLMADPPEVVRDTLQRSRVVIATGRAAVEAMACGASVVIADDRKYQGPLLDPDTVGAMNRNYSGRGGVVPTQDAMHAAILAAGGDHLGHVRRHHDARVIAQQILERLC